jgi:hypothetical protein
MSVGKTMKLISNVYLNNFSISVFGQADTTKIYLR